MAHFLKNIYFLRASRGGCPVVSVIAFYSNDPSLSAAIVCCFILHIN